MVSPKNIKAFQLKPVMLPLQLPVASHHKTFFPNRQTVLCCFLENESFSIIRGKRTFSFLIHVVRNAPAMRLVLSGWSAAVGENYVFNCIILRNIFIKTDFAIFVLHQFLVLHES